MARQLTDEEILEYKNKEATTVQERYADWLIEKLQLEFPNPKSEAAFREAVRLATALRMIFQASPENQEARENARSEREEAPAPAKPAKAAKAAKAQPAAAEPEAEAPKRKGGRPKKAAASQAATPESDQENGGDTAVAPAARPSKPTKAARSGRPAPF